MGEAGGFAGLWEGWWAHAQAAPQERCVPSRVRARRECLVEERQDGVLSGCLCGVGAQHGMVEHKSTRVMVLRCCRHGVIACRGKWGGWHEWRQGVRERLWVCVGKEQCCWLLWPCMGIGQGCRGAAACGCG